MLKKLPYALAGALMVPALFSAPLAGAAEVEETVETTVPAQTGGFTFYRSYQSMLGDAIRCSTSPQRWWCP
ncbi:hypothetical protein [Corynebacterium camporealensis]|uniref:Uncharacterized protein n=1 Tax=Corynebacterium camporealensis TaxID=161896 RepID=A0A0F6T9X9_9CORY|nr:hypothetical protein [Corynebacterium camporealensis]AKE38034.1 hypothetical protein UL81_00200 [Corynebacterium camporealensis]MDY5840713.1 hypothetical protein [Corynebacterium camporealensis]